MKSVRSALAVLLLLAWMVYPQAICRELTESEKGAGLAPVPLVRIIALPEKYADKYIGVCGVLSTGYEDSALYLSTESALYLTGDKLDIVYTPNVLFEGSRKKSNVDAGSSKREFHHKMVFVSGKLSSDGTVLTVSRVMLSRRFPL